MSRQAPSRNLTLTEELERLEQSITLTLQEIDRNFSRAHRIVTTSILPVVEQYGEHSRNVWEASKFWKQFFEASANVSLSGYEEQANDEGTTKAEETTQIADTTEVDYTPQDHQDPGEESAFYDRSHHRDVEESLLDDGSLAGSTPRPPASKGLRPQMQFAEIDTPYETLRRELKGEADNATVMTEDGLTAGGAAAHEDDETMTMELPGVTTQTRLPDMTMTPHSSSILEAPTPMQQRAGLSGGKGHGKNKDPLLHRILDKNYRIQATPHKSGSRSGGLILSPNKRAGGGAGGGDPKDQTRRALWQDSPMSSPEIAAPKLRTNLYSTASPLKARRGLGGARNAGADGGPRTPGVSVQTPTTARKTKDVFAGMGASNKGKAAAKDEITWESDDDEETGDVLFGGMSPPKTIQFALPPSKLLQTPAREASKRIVQDILLTAGAAPEYLEGDEEYSPTMVKMSKDILDDTF
ncbi:DASH complex subunit Ask1-domain-containing protein [Xylariales sp. PMI_506]|nr:DASH complex subunit Ask1-domain-containing protein [Xylariales sp. PMI_506]